METLAVRNATKSFPREDGTQMPVLDGLTFRLEPGKVTAIIGPSGCGKTTLLNVIADLERLDDGSIVLETEDRSARPYSPENIGYVFQSHRLLPWRTVERNITLALEGHRIPKSDWQRRVDQYLEMVGLADFKRQYPLFLSGGMLQRVGLARALALETDVVLMDEPFASVDELTAQNLRESTRSLCEQLQRTVLFVTHNLHEAAYISDAVIVLSPRPAAVRHIVPNPAPLPREWGSPAGYEFAKQLSSLIAEDAREDARNESATASATPQRHQA